MNAHYSRMRAYAPFFDSRTDWYPNAWAYENAYAIYPGAAKARRPSTSSRTRRAAASTSPTPATAAPAASTPPTSAIPAGAATSSSAPRPVSRAGYKGIFVDDVNLAFKVSDGNGNRVAPMDPRTGQTMTHTNWQRYFAEFMEQLRAELPASAEIVHNQVYFDVGLSSPYVRRAIDAATHIEIERGGERHGHHLGHQAPSASRP